MACWPKEELSLEWPGQRTPVLSWKLILYFIFSGVISQSAVLQSPPITPLFGSFSLKANSPHLSQLTGAGGVWGYEAWHLSVSSEYNWDFLLKLRLTPINKWVPILMEKITQLEKVQNYQDIGICHISFQIETTPSGIKITESFIISHHLTWKFCPALL